MFIRSHQVDYYRTRALAAYYRGGGVRHPSYCTAALYQGRSYIYLHNGDGPNEGIDAVYRIDTAGRLKRLKRWPSEAAREADQKSATYVM